MGDAGKNAERTKSIQNAAGTISTDPWNYHLPWHDGVPSSRHLDPAYCVDGAGYRYLLRV
jgi:hypothetical protein